MNPQPTLVQDAEDRLLDAALAEVVRAGGTARTAPSISRWMAAAILLLGIGVMVVVALQPARPAGASAQATAWQEPELPPMARADDAAALAQLDRRSENLWCKLRPADMPLLGEFHALRNLLLEEDVSQPLGAATAAWSLEPLLRCTRLQSLTIGNLGRCDLDQYGLLVKLPELRRLGLIGVNHLVDAEFVGVLQKLPLRSLSFAATNMEPAGFSALCGLPLLEQLSLRDCLHLDRCDLRQLRHLVQLRSLALRSVGGRLADSLSKSHPLADEPSTPEPAQPAGVLGTGLGMPGRLSLLLDCDVMAAIATLPQLRALDLQNSVVDDATMAALPGKLEALDLGEVIDLSAAGVASVAKLPNLWRFGFSDGNTETLRMGDAWDEASVLLTQGQPRREEVTRRRDAAQRAVLEYCRQHRFTRLTFRGTITQGVQEALQAQTELTDLELVFLGHKAAFDLDFTKAMPRLERLTITNAPDFDPAPLAKLERLRLVQLNSVPRETAARVRQVLSDRVRVVASGSE